MARTLYASLQSSSIDFGTLHKNYHPVLALVKELIGTIPNCDPILEIWPIGFRTYNLLVPNLLNLPNTLFGSKKLKTSLGLALYSSSKAAQCPYCTAHTCSFALRRGLKAESIGGNRTPGEQAVVVLAEGMSEIPANITAAQCQALTEYFSAEEISSIVFGIGLMGFLNKFMNGMGVELEQDAINDVGALLSENGWNPRQHVSGKMDTTKSTLPRTDSLLTYLKVVKQAPGAIRLEKEWTRGVPDSYPAASDYLKKHTGYAFPILKHISRKRVIRALTTVLRDNLDKEKTVVGLGSKCLAAYVFAAVVSNNELKTATRAIAKHLAPEFGDDVYEQLDKVAQEEIPNDMDEANKIITHLLSLPNLSRKDGAVVLLARSASTSPTMVNDTVIEICTAELTPASIVEIMVWLSVQQLLSRLGSYYTANGSMAEFILGKPYRVLQQ